jgi:hypothetical protein
VSVSEGDPRGGLVLLLWFCFRKVFSARCCAQGELPSGQVNVCVGMEKRARATPKARLGFKSWLWLWNGRCACRSD